MDGKKTPETKSMSEVDRKVRKPMLVDLNFWIVRRNHVAAVCTCEYVYQ